MWHAPVTPRGTELRALRDAGRDVEHYFQEVLSAFEQRADQSDALSGRLLQLYHQIVADTEPSSSGAPSDCPLPNPDMSFYLWTEELDIWRELSKWFRTSSSSDSFSTSQDQDQDRDQDQDQDQDQDDFDLGDSPLELPSDMARFSVMSNDSGIERDLPLSAELCLGGAEHGKRCEVSVCYKTDSSSDWTLRRPRPSPQIQPLHPTFCSLLCLPIVTFSGALP
ncbi:phosphoinositide 3-kinase regulatory subunit 6-like [Periophthalmus magnuspinnatus]|uniref:phosphoinositide 3-kinase regulatory subunit 6-like n=1 Tax=Periophthalmus magnuspinnatus TaxID=409849 RepID=UPI00145AD61C|nr:phosphoinositide 3-kinase regulatory subunit 6-like [Periophthalmus magnuspinnatus]